MTPRCKAHKKRSFPLRLKYEQFNSEWEQDVAGGKHTLLQFVKNQARKQFICLFPKYKKYKKRRFDNGKILPDSKGSSKGTTKRRKVLWERQINEGFLYNKSRCQLFQHRATSGTFDLTPFLNTAPMIFLDSL